MILSLLKFILWGKILLLISSKRDIINSRVFFLKEGEVLRTSKKAKMYIFLLFLTIITLSFSNKFTFAKVKNVKSTASYSAKKKQAKKFNERLLFSEIIKSKTAKNQINKQILPDLDLQEVYTDSDVKTPHSEHSRNLLETLVCVFVVLFLAMFCLSIIFCEIKKSFKNYKN